jgi:hypothetical protein
MLSIMNPSNRLRFWMKPGPGGRDFLAFLVVTGILFGPAALPAQPDTREMERLIRQLGNPRHKERQAADRRLRTMGEPALIALRQAEKTCTDPEIQRRAGQLAQAMAQPLGIGGRLLWLEGGTASMVFSHDSRWLATGGSSGKVRLWDLKAADPSATYVEGPGHSGPIRQHEMAVSPNGRWLVTAAADRTARLWDLQTIGTAAKSPVLPGYFSPGGNRLPAEGSLAISLNSRWLIMQGTDQTARMWDLAARDPAARCVILGQVAAPKGMLGRLITSPNGRWLALPSSDYQTVRVLDLDADDPSVQPWQVRVPQGSIRRVWAISATGRWLGVIHANKEDENVQLWDLKANKPWANRIELPDFG